MKSSCLWPFHTRRTRWEPRVGHFHAHQKSINQEADESTHHWSGGHFMQEQGQTFAVKLERSSEKGSSLICTHGWYHMNKTFFWPVFGKRLIYPNSKWTSRMVVSEGLGSAILAVFLGAECVSWNEWLTSSQQDDEAFPKPTKVHA